MTCATCRSHKFLDVLAGLIPTLHPVVTSAKLSRRVKELQHRNTGVAAAESLAAVFSGESGRVRLQSLQTPVPQSGELLVRVEGCTLCGSDLHSIEGRRTVPVPTVLGHEIVGRIEQLGAGEPLFDVAGQPLSLGDRIVWAIVASCGQCFYCQRGLPQKCRHAVKYGHEAFRPGYELLGGLAEHCLLTRGTAVVRIPPALSLSAVCPASCATATITAALEAAGDLRGQAICITGAGLLGLTAAAMARSSGASEVIVCEVNQQRRELAGRFGATRCCTPAELSETIRDATGGMGVDAAVEVSGAPAAFEALWPGLRLGAAAVLVGSVFPAAPVSLALEQVVRRNLSLRGIHNYAPVHLQRAIQFLETAGGEYDFGSLVSAWYPLQQISDALISAADPAAVRIGVCAAE